MNGPVEHILEFIGFLGNLINFLLGFEHLVRFVVFFAVNKIHFEVIYERNQREESLFVRFVLLELDFQDFQEFQVEVVKRFEKLEHQLRLIYGDTGKHLWDEFTDH